jgi:type I restriction enzyme S subunit
VLEEVGITSLPHDWGIVRIESLLSPDRGISVGVMYPGEHDPLGIPLIKAGDLSGSRIVSNPTFRISREKHEEYRRTALSGGELLLSLVGDVGRCAVVPARMKGWNAARAIAVLRLVDPSDAAFLRFCLMSSPLQHLMQAWSTTTVQATLNLKEIRQIPLPWPSKGHRDAIAHILGTLDDKIELNRRMNETLEALAQAIFDDMFESDVPDAVVGDLADIEHDGVSPMDHEDELFDLYSLPAFDEGRRPVRERGGNIKSNKFVVRAGVVLLSKLNPSIPRVWYPHVRQEPRSIASTEFQVMRPRAPSSPEFMYCLLRSEPVRDHLVGLASGTSNSHQRVKPDDLLATPCPKPSPDSLDRFTQTVRPMLERVNAGIDESATLAALRDTLLPKLLSGELRIPDAEKMVEATL